MQLYSGFFLPYDKADVQWKVLMLLNPEFWVYSALMKINLEGQKHKCVAPAPPAPIDQLQALTNETYRDVSINSALSGVRCRPKPETRNAKRETRNPRNPRNPELETRNPGITRSAWPARQRRRSSGLGTTT